MIRYRYASVLFILLAFLFSCTAKTPKFEADLNGFRLWQFTEAAKTHFGKPYKTQKRGEYAFEAYGVTDDSYMVIEHWEKYKHNMYSLQITGYPTTMIPFKGLVLGDPEAKVREALGRPGSSKKIEKPPVTINYYDETNYSTEIDKDGRLYSIKVHVNSDFMNKAEIDFYQWEKFKKAVFAKDIQAILELVRPDVEIYKGGVVLSIKKRYSDFKKKPDKDFVQALIGDRDSVLEELGKTEPEGAIRLAENVGVGQVFKFPEGKILNEIVFFPYNGKYRIYEIAFREKEGKKAGKRK